MGKLISIDNGGTLTDVCVVDGGRVHHTKVLTTPHDLSQCVLDGLEKASAVIFGEKRIVDLLRDTDCIRYSTTQGTNALVERKGPRIGLVLDVAASTDFLCDTEEQSALLFALVGDRVGHVDSRLEGEAYGVALVAAVNELTALGASRLVVSFAGPRFVEEEARFRRHWLHGFPRHMLGAVPALCSHEIADDPDDARRTWTALLNAFLHPGMERLLYHAERRLREARYRPPLLVFCNDGDSARVAKTVAVKTYSSGPRGGMEGARALAARYGFEHLISLDVGGTSADMGSVEGGAIRDRRHGHVEGIPIAFPLGDVVSVGVGGSSILRAVDGRLLVGPQSVGAAPGPACFGRGGTEATITDAFLAEGLLDPDSFFGGALRLDVERAERAVRQRVAEPLGLELEAGLAAMEQAWIGRIADALGAYAPIGPATTLLAFGGAGPLEACSIAERVGIERVLVPGLAAVFSAFGIGFSDIAHRYEARLREPSDAALRAVVATVVQRAERDMFAEGVALPDCERELRLRITRGGLESIVELDGHLALPPGLRPGDDLVVALRAARVLEHPPLASETEASAGEGSGRAGPAVSRGTRRVLSAAQGWRDLPVFRAEEQAAGASGEGPAIVEQAFFTCRIPRGWRFRFTANLDIVLDRAEKAGRA